MFEKFRKVSFNEFGFNPLYCVSLPGYTWQCCLNYTGINLHTLQDKALILTLGNNIRGGVSSIMGDRQVISDEKKKILYMDATKLYGHSMIQPLPNVEIEMWPDFYMNNLEAFSNTLEDSDTGYFVEVDLKYPDIIKEKTKDFPLCPEKEIFAQDKYNDNMKKIKPKNYNKAKKINM